jgi:glycogen synthase
MFRHDPAEHARRVRAGMETDTSWDASARQYVELYLSALRAAAR